MQPYPFIWADDISLALLHDYLLLQARIVEFREIIEDDGLTVVTPHGGIAAHPLLNAERQAVSAAGTMLKRLESRIELMAPRDGKGHRRPYDLVPGAGVIPNAVDHPGGEDEDDLLLGGKGSLLN